MFVIFLLHLVSTILILISVILKVMRIHFFLHFYIYLIKLYKKLTNLLAFFVLISIIP